MNPKDPKSDPRGRGSLRGMGDEVLPDAVAPFVLRTEHRRLAREPPLAERLRLIRHEPEDDDGVFLMQR